MAWLYMKLPGGVLKVKPRGHMRTVEVKREVPVLDLWFVVFSWWSHDQLSRDTLEQNDRWQRRTIWRFWQRPAWRRHSG